MARRLRSHRPGVAGPSLIGYDSRKIEPRGGRQAFSFVYKNCFYTYRVKSALGDLHPEYYTEDQLLPLQRFDFFSGQWSSVSPVCVDLEPLEERHLTGVCCAVLGDCAYTFGGRWSYGRVDELNLETMIWRRLEPQNREEGPMDKVGTGMVACGDEALCVFGGCGSDTSHKQPGATYLSVLTRPGNCWTNELHVFNTKTEKWSSPETTGPRPSPCGSFSFTKVDLFRAIIFGGRQKYQIVNEIHILDMKSWHWSGAIVPTSYSDPWPQERCLHSACALVDPKFYLTIDDSATHEGLSDSSSHLLHPKLFVLWGSGEDTGELARNAWILDVNSKTWTSVKLSLGPAHKEFSLGCQNRSPTEAELVVFGGSKVSVSSDAHLYTSGTTLLYLGVRSLYYSCVVYIAKRNEFTDSLLQRSLPPHIENDISRERQKRTKVAHYEYQLAVL